MRVPVIAVTALALWAGSAHAAPITWVGPNLSFWDLAANWNPGLPGAADDALLGTANTNFRSGTVGINSFTGTGSLTVSGGQLAVANASSIGSLVMTSGSLGGAGDITVTGTSTITFGDMRGPGTTILQGASTINSSGFRLDGGRTLRNQNTLTWSAGSIVFNNTFNGASGGAGSGTIVNAAGATFVASGSGPTSIIASNFGGTDTGADALISNLGTFRKSGSNATDTTAIAVAFDNSGTVDVQSGILNLTNGGNHTGNFSVAAGTVLGFAGGTHNLNAGAVTSPGTVRVVNGTTVLNVNTAYSIAGTTEIQSGFMNLLAGNATTGALVQSSGSVSGSNNLTVTGPATLTFGDHRGTGTTILQGASTISGSGFRLDGGRTLRNQNTLTWTAGQYVQRRERWPRLGNDQ
jgi:fibronectin-binding autotransporter adhesin